MITSQQAAAKWATNTAAASESFKLGVQSVTESPMAKAAANVNGYLQGVQAAVSSGKWQNALMASPLQGWKDSMLGKGAQRIAAGVNAAKPKMAAFLQQFLPLVEQAKREIDATMPRGSIDQNLARANALARRLAEFKYQRQG